MTSAACLRIRALIGVLAASVFILGAPLATAQDPALFIDPTQVVQAQISPDGHKIGVITRTGEHQTLSVIEVETRTQRVIQDFTGKDRFALNWVRWKDASRLVVGATAKIKQKGQVSTGKLVKEDDIEYTVSRVFTIGADGKNLVQMFQDQMNTLLGGSGYTDLLDVLPGDPSNVLITASDNYGIGVWKADVTNGKAVRVADGDFTTVGYAVDGAGYPVMRIDATEDVAHIKRRASGTRPWIDAGEVRRNVISNTSNFDTLGPGPGPNQVYVLALHNSDHANVHIYDASTGEFGPALASSAEADQVGPWIDPFKRQLVATCEFGTLLACRTVDPKLQKYVKALDAYFQHKATFQVVNMSADLNRWLLRVEQPEAGLSYYVFDVSSAAAEPFITRQPAVPAGTYSPAEVVPYTARDGVKLWAYVTGKPADGPRPMVVMPHGGPEARDYYGFDEMAQYLAAQGYLVLQPNFRGSDGSGKAFAEAGHGQWGKRMQDDVTDAVKHMVDIGKADPKRICIVGASYGGYAALAGVTLTPDLYRCAVSIAGVSDLEEILRSEKKDSGGYSNVFYYWRSSIGDPGKDRDALRAVSPRRLVDKVQVPILLIHGDKDETVPPNQSAIMQDALKAAGKTSRLIKVPKANHYWAEWDRDDLIMMFRETGAFLKQNLG